MNPPKVRELIDPRSQSTTRVTENVDTHTSFEICMEKCARPDHATRFVRYSGAAPLAQRQEAKDLPTRRSRPAHRAGRSGRGTCAHLQADRRSPIPWCTVLSLKSRQVSIVAGLGASEVCCSAQRDTTGARQTGTTPLRRRFSLRASQSRAADFCHAADKKNTLWRRF